MWCVVESVRFLKHILTHGSNYLLGYISFELAYIIIPERLVNVFMMHNRAGNKIIILNMSTHFIFFRLDVCNYPFKHYFLMYYTASIRSKNAFSCLSSVEQHRFSESYLKNVHFITVIIVTQLCRRYWVFRPLTFLLIKYVIKIRPSYKR